MKKILLFACLCTLLSACKKSAAPAPDTGPASIVGNWVMIVHQASVYDDANKFLGLESLYLEKLTFTADGKMQETTITGSTYTSTYVTKAVAGKNYLVLNSKDPDTGATYTDQYEITELSANRLDFTTGELYSSEPFPYRDGILAKVKIRIVATR